MAGKKLVQGGEMIGNGGVTVIVNGSIMGTPAGKDPVEVLLGDRRFKQAVLDVRSRGGSRPLPGGGGFNR